MVSESRKRIHKKSLRTLFSILCGLLAGIILCSHTAFADENIPSDLGLEGSVSDPSNPITAEEDYVYREASKGISEVIYGTSDTRATSIEESIYQYLVQTIHPDLTTIQGKIDTTNSRLLSLVKSLNNGSTSYNSQQNIYFLLWSLYDILGGQNAAGSFPSQILGELSFDYFTTTPAVTVKDLVYSIFLSAPDTALDYWQNMLVTSSNTSGGVYQVASNTSLTNTKLDNVNNQLTSIGNTLNELNKLTWISRTCTFKGFTDDFSSFSTEVGYHPNDYFVFNFSPINYTPVLYRITLPINNRQTYQYQLPNIQFGRVYNNEFIKFDNCYLGYVYSARCVYLYFTSVQAASDYAFYIPFSQNYLWNNTDFSLECIYLDNYNSIEFYNGLLRQAGISNINRIADVVAPEDYMEAREASKPVIDEALSDFTGQGSSAPSVSDVSSASDISDSVSEGVDAGGAVSDALTVFSPASDIYMWFSQDNKNYFVPLDVNYPSYYNPSTDRTLPVYIDYATHELVINGVHYPLYPVPVRGSGNGNKSKDDIVWTDDVPDVLTYYNQQVQSQIGDDK